jgi:hypothetical protein
MCLGDLFNLFNLILSIVAGALLVLSVIVVIVLKLEEECELKREYYTCNEPTKQKRFRNK